MKKWADQMDALLIDTDRLLSCETNFSIGKWIDDARSFGKQKLKKNIMRKMHVVS
ncbi:alpha-N-acetylglucosaminidase C-terminal domain-containing protein [Bacteroides thetaiotaomicron]|uniref:alpha-N-acetylglucosaminidase C-terminal domain-containing protein n=1 Tax=Bacteroides thetaiotaomicron TaxID=818 RepID=UPI0021669BC8|nr:alpha-N-acetylglucosaminidase C-terminal domain-containing protein [Bacteroides thetaiotaomicron]MCS3332243.1 alpha-N-acetylglucosaminidase C-terminal domain-containing protein [Bacteroides thetaiotaomicron]